MTTDTDTDINDDVDDESIAALMTEAGAAGDLAQVRLCKRALAGDQRARAACVEVILDARAQWQP